jgi:hypothetical protein
MDALRWEKEFLESHPSSHQTRERLKQIKDQWDHLSTQDGEAEPSIVMKDQSLFGVLLCGVMRGV